MIWERIKRITEAELPPIEAGAAPRAAGVRLDRAPPPHWSEHFALAKNLRGQELVFEATPAQEDAKLPQIDAQIHQANLLYEAEFLNPTVLEVMGALGARDPSDLVVRAANTAGPDRDRAEADRSMQVLNNAGALLVENEATDISLPVDVALCAELIRAGCVNHTE